MFEREFDIPYYGLGADGRMKPEALLEFLQETAATHADSGGFGVSDLLGRGLTWVLRRYRVNIKSRPGRRGLRVSTWYAPWKNLFSVRAFNVRTDSGEAAADAWSAWIALDLSRNRPVRLDRVLPGAYFDMAEPTGEPVTDDPPEVGGDFDYEAAFRARRGELDMNGHTNHTAYFCWALESIPDDEITGLSPITLDAEFLSPVKREGVIVRAKKTCQDPLSFAHTIYAESGTVAVNIVTVWGAVEPL